MITLRGFQWGFILLAWLILGSAAPAQEKADKAAARKVHDAANTQFESIVERFVTFFKSRRQLLYHYERKKDQKAIAYLVEVNCTAVTYKVDSNVQSADTTHRAEILLTLEKVTNRSCGDVSGQTAFGQPDGFSTVDAALGSARRECFKRPGQMKAVQTRLQFVYSGGVWRFETAQSPTTGEADLQLMLALGMPAAPAIPLVSAEAQARNVPWAALITR